MSDIREQIKHIAYNLVANGHDVVYFNDYIDKLKALIPRWQSFSEAKPDIKLKILIKYPNGAVEGLYFWDKYLGMWTDERTKIPMENLISRGYQWLRIPE